ncbi:DUF5937 family protein [Brevibacillus daliensis]|uniref:DUF5937 family protein n=1 Tax=Brevibacillus daliensis TaxID=2892995 RepID=UPI001E5AABCF|nr:DUF5937 family protein [Brevibacillus daliensis]
MITIQMKDLTPNNMELSISPMLELAGGLHLLTQQFVHHLHQACQTELLQMVKQEELYQEFLYFSPLFSDGIPDLFLPNYSDGVLEWEDQFEYLYQIDLDLFISSCNRAFIHYTDRRPGIFCSLEEDYLFDPEHLFNRFLLFMSSYMRLVFWSAWNNQYPVLMTMKEQLRNYLSQSSDNVSHFLHALVPDCKTNGENETLLLPSLYTPVAHQDSVLRLRFYISWYLRQPLFCFSLHHTNSLVVSFPSLLFRHPSK